MSYWHTLNLRSITITHVWVYCDSESSFEIGKSNLHDLRWLSTSYKNRNIFYPSLVKFAIFVTSLQEIEKWILPKIDMVVPKFPSLYFPSATIILKFRGKSESFSLIFWFFINTFFQHLKNILMKTKRKQTFRFCFFETSKLFSDGK